MKKYFENNSKIKGVKVTNKVTLIKNKEEIPRGFSSSITENIMFLETKEGDFFIKKNCNFFTSDDLMEVLTSREFRLAKSEVIKMIKHKYPFGIICEALENNLVPYSFIMERSYEELARDAVKWAEHLGVEIPNVKYEMPEAEALKLTEEGYKFVAKTTCLHVG